jgi:apolipoprotein D and lipocalin family protein
MAALFAMKPSNGKRTLVGLMLVALALPACHARSYPPLQLAESVDIPRFMGPWYVIACIPSLIERHGYNAVESDRLDPDGRIRTVFTFNEGSFTGPSRRLAPVGFVTEGTRGAVWGMRFIWPIKADYRIMYLASDYSQTVIGREKRDYAWIMARTATLSDSDYQRLSGLLRDQGYDTTLLRMVPQRSGVKPER